MNKVIAAIVLMSMFNNYIMCMKSASNGNIEQQSLQLQLVSPTTTVSEQYLPTAILGKICIESFKEEKTKSSIKITNSPMLVEKQIRTFCAINTELCRYLCCPNNIRTIITNACHGIYYSRRGLLVKNITIPAVQNYLQKTLALHAYWIGYMSEDDIRKLVAGGADVNYCHFDEYGHGITLSALTNICSPLLFKTQNNYNKSELLCELGANPTQCFLNLNDKCCDQFTYGYVDEIKELLLRKKMISPLEYAQRQKNSELVELFSKYLSS